MAHRSSLIVAALALLLAVPAQATKVQVSHFPPNPGVLPGGGWKFSPNTTFGDPPPARQWVEGVYGAQPSPTAPALIVKDVVKVAGRAGDLPVTVAQAITIVDAAISVAACVNGAIIGCVSAGVAAVTLYEQYRIRPVPGGGLEADPGQPQVDVSGFKCVTGNVVGYGASDREACQAVADQLTKVNYNGNAEFPCGQKNTYSVGTLQAAGNLQLLMTWTRYQVAPFQGSCPAGGGPSAAGGMLFTATTIKQCPAVVDFSDPRYSSPGGPMGADQLCPTGRYNRITPADAGAKLAAYPPTLPNATFKQAVIDAIDNGGQTAPGDLTSTGPASQTGTPTSSTTTDSSGTKTTTSTPTYTYHYDGDTITYDTTNTVQTCVGASSCSTTTTTTPAAPADAQDPTDPCTKNPDRAGCSKLGTPPDPEGIQTKDIPVSVTPQSGFGADDGVCPGPITLSSGTVVDPYGLFCRYMSGIRFAVLGIAWIIAGLIFLGRTD